MLKLISISVFVLFLGSCKELRKNLQLEKQNQLLITSEGDSLEDGFWKYIDDDSGLSKMGEYKNGFKTGEWTYTISDLITSVEWMCFDGNGVKFNFPRQLKLSDSLEHPFIFKGENSSGNDKTYISLLRYDFDSTESIIYDYVFEANSALESDQAKTVKEKSVKKFFYRSLELFAMDFQVEKEDVLYRIISFVFEVNDHLYDFTIRNSIEEMDVLEIEIFKDMFYSMECNGVDLFNYGTGLYLKSWDIEFE